MKKISFLAVILLLSVSAFAILPPGNVQAAFKKMYPKANGVASVSYTHLDVYKRQVLLQTR